MAWLGLDQRKMAVASAPLSKYSMRIEYLRPAWKA